jgi:hypothetical protein
MFKTRSSLKHSAAFGADLLAAARPGAGEEWRGGDRGKLRAICLWGRVHRQSDYPSQTGPLPAPGKKGSYCKRGP